MQGKGRAVVCDLPERRYVSLSGLGFQVNVLDKDWVKIAPYLGRGKLDPLLYPLPSDVQLQDRILGVLQTLFTPPST